MKYMKKEFDYLVFIGRFQPPHYGHFKVIETAFRKAAHVLILLGSSNSGRTLRNPFTFEERVQMLLAEPDLKRHAAQGHITFLPIDDHTYADQDWVKQVQDVVHQATNPPTLSEYFANGDPKIGLIGCAKDNTSYYLKLFPQWDSVDVKQEVETHSTQIRDAMFKYGVWSFDKQMPKSVNDQMMKTDLNLTDANRKLREEYAWVQKYKALWANTPYPVIFNTVDAVVIQSGHILIVKRGAMPGKGLWAMPGGYINPDEQLVQSMLRELREETKIQVDEWTLKQCIKKSETFADPHRSARGRVITHAFLIQLPDKKTLPRVKGSDDAEKAKWVPLADLRADNMFEDHYAIIRKLIAGL
jgi:bifunctional NMN adenylyltransferase/nudix hydrolase